MEIWEQLRQSISALYTFNTFITNQIEVRHLQTLCESSKNIGLININGVSGNGITHVLYSVCHELKNRHGANVFYSTGENLLYIYKKLQLNNKLTEFKQFIVSHDAIVIDNAQVFYRKKACTDFIYEIMEYGLLNKQSIVIGCANPEKNILHLKRFRNSNQVHNIVLNLLPHECIYKILKNLCEYESGIPDWILTEISSYTAPTQKHINCLISIRFKSKVAGIDLHKLATIEFHEIFNISRYFKGGADLQLEIELPPSKHKLIK